MSFIWYKGKNLDGVESKKAALERKRHVYGGVLVYNEYDVPCLRGFDIKKIEGQPSFFPLKEGDRLMLLR